MSLIARLVRHVSDVLGREAAGEASGEPDGRLAATALLVHVARADGVLDPAEADRLARLVQARHGMSRSAAEALVDRADALDAGTRDVADLVERIGRGAGPDERARLLAMAWAVADADGAVHEAEEALVWRLGRLLGLDEAGIADTRAGARRSAEGDGAPVP